MGVKRGKITDQMRWKQHIITIAIIVVSLCFCSYYVAQKEGYHGDEILSYGLSNSQYSPWIVPTQPEGRLAKFYYEYIQGDYLLQEIEHIKNVVDIIIQDRSMNVLVQYEADVYDAPVWIGREEFKRYLQVDISDDYHLLSPYYNLTDDPHPPLYNMLLHLISSLVKGEISVWTGASINLICMGVTLWFVGKIGEMVFLKQSTTWASMILYGFSTGIVATSIWIRMYSLLTLFMVMNLYYHLQAYEKGKWSRWKKRRNQTAWIGNRGIFYTTLLAFWSQYFSLFFLIPMAIVTVLVLWTKKKKKEMITYMRTMFLAAVVGVIGNPFSIRDILFSGRGQEAIGQWETIWQGYDMRFTRFFQILCENVSVNEIVFLSILLLYVGAFLYHRKRITTKGVFCVVPTLVYFLIVSKMSPYLVDRYIMAIFPMVCLWIGGMVEEICTLLDKWIVCRWNKRTSIIISAVIVLCGILSVKGEYPYLYKGYEMQLELAREYEEYPLICIYTGGFHENKVEMTYYEQTILVKLEELVKMDEERTQVTENGYVVLIKDVLDEEKKKVLEAVMDTFGGYEVRELLDKGVHDDFMYFVQ